ncbi:MAG: glucosamine-6-phosphate deaminase [Planctomycetota bacterium]
MNILICETAEAAAALVAEEILAALGQKPELVLGLATGSTPIGVYARLVRAHREQQVDLADLRTFNLDEYIGLPADHPQSYRAFMQEHLFGGLELPAAHVHFPPSEGPDLRRRCADYEQAIRDAGGIDIQLLGIGSNGHIGFNEPTSSLASRTRLKTLTDKTLRDNARFYGSDEEQPQVAATMGIGTILEARRILLQSFGSRKAEAVRAAVEGPITSFWPASALQLHPDVTFYLDPESAARLTMRDYYRRVHDNEVDLDRRGLL